VGIPADYLSAHPAASTIACVLEVSDSSLEYDRGTKRRVYAAAGIKSYVIINLREQQVEMHAVPNVDGQLYEDLSVLHRGETMRLPVGGMESIEVSVDDLLPPI
jgi:Uma2 family endonuclease